MKTFQIYLHPIGLTDSSFQKTYFRETVKDEGGNFCVPLPLGGTYYFRLSSSCYIERIFSPLEVPAGTGLPDFHIELDPGLGLSGRVIEDATGNPVAAVLIGTCEDHYRTNPHEIIAKGWIEDSVHAWTDEEGCFQLKGLKGITQNIFALHQDFAEASMELKPGEVDNVELRLEAGFRIFGKTYDDNGELLAGVEIYLYGDRKRMRMHRRVHSRPDGVYRTAPALPGQVTVSATYWTEEMEQPSCFTDEEKNVLLIDKDVEINFGPSHEEYVTWCGTLYGLDQTPARNGRLVIQQDSSYHFNRRIRDRTVICDELGRFEVRKLMPGFYVVKSVSEMASSGSDLTAWGNPCLTVPSQKRAFLTLLSL